MISDSKWLSRQYRDKIEAAWDKFEAKFAECKKLFDQQIVLVEHDWMLNGLPVEQQVIIK